jgi:hypothetical protein
MSCPGGKWGVQTPNPPPPVASPLDVGFIQTQSSSSYLLLTGNFSSKKLESFQGCGQMAIVRLRWHWIVLIPMQTNWIVITVITRTSL